MTSLGSTIHLTVRPTHSISFNRRDTKWLFLQSHRPTTAIRAIDFCCAANWTKYFPYTLLFSYHFRHVTKCHFMHKKFGKEVNHLDDTAKHVWLLYYWDQRVSSATCHCHVSSADASHYHQWYKASRTIRYILWLLRVLLLGILLGNKYSNVFGVSTCLHILESPFDKRV